MCRRLIGMANAQQLALTGSVVMSVSCTYRNPFSTAVQQINHSTRSKGTIKLQHLTPPLALSSLGYLKIKYKNMVSL